MMRLVMLLKQGHTPRPMQVFNTHARVPRVASFVLCFVFCVLLRLCFVAFVFVCCFVPLRYNNSPGLRNPNFFPLRTPFPSLAMRYMVPSDLPFLSPSKYEPSLRVAFLESFLRRFGAAGPEVTTSPPPGHTQVRKARAKESKEIAGARKALEKAKEELAAAQSAAQAAPSASKPPVPAPSRSTHCPPILSNDAVSLASGAFDWSGQYTLKWLRRWFSGTASPKASTTGACQAHQSLPPPTNTHTHTTHTHTHTHTHTRTRILNTSYFTSQMHHLLSLSPRVDRRGAPL